MPYVLLYYAASTVFFWTVGQYSITCDIPDNKCCIPLRTRLLQVFSPPRMGFLPGLGLRMLTAWRDLPANRNWRWVTATVADDNPAAQSLFQRLAHSAGVECTVNPHFTADLFPVAHPAEPLHRIGPFSL